MAGTWVNGTIAHKSTAHVIKTGKRRTILKLLCVSRLPEILVLTSQPFKKALLVAPLLL